MNEKYNLFSMIDKVQKAKYIIVTIKKFVGYDFLPWWTMKLLHI